VTTQINLKLLSHLSCGPLAVSARASVLCDILSRLSVLSSASARSRLTSRLLMGNSRHFSCLANVPHIRRRTLCSQPVCRHLALLTQMKKNSDNAAPPPPMTFFNSRLKTILFRSGNFVHQCCPDKRNVDSYTSSTISRIYHIFPSQNL
jgi:hypothetical protein